ncbi:MAG: sigma-70 family RNA polymerase sigma factor [Peptostreptococcaceae bacterium]|jgi:RNA polymerase sporulation-specific sigma factor|nr:sigma-70 family RNA polymerase sigma factor [Peptostreptococcaceae bacterium]
MCELNMEFLSNFDSSKLNIKKNKNNDLDYVITKDIISSAKQNDYNAIKIIIDNYYDYIKLKENKYFVIGAEKEDLYQEGLIGLYKAIKSYDFCKNNSFSKFAKMCINRQIISAIKTANRKKHHPLNFSISLNNDKDEKMTIGNADSYKFIESNLNPEELVLQKEQKDIYLEFIDKNLSGFEKKVLNLYSKGKTYQEIGFLLNKKTKSIDNAIQRIKTKLKKENQK